VFVELGLNDLVEAAIDGGKTFMHLLTETADLKAHVADLIVGAGLSGARALGCWGAGSLG
jgi:hypothetical protein